MKLLVEFAVYNVKENLENYSKVIDIKESKIINSKKEIRRYKIKIIKISTNRSYFMVIAVLSDFFNRSTHIV